VNRLIVELLIYLLGICPILFFLLRGVLRLVRPFSRVEMGETASHPLSAEKEREVLKTDRELVRVVLVMCVVIGIPGLILLQPERGQMNDLAKALVLVGVAFAATTGIAVYVNATVSRTSPIGVLRRLRKSPSAYAVRLRGTASAWNPDPRGGVARSRSVTGPGVATYSINTSPDGEESVILDWRPRDGQPRRMEGVLSPRLSHKADGTLLGRLLVSPLLLFGVPAVLAAIGVVVGLGLTTGHEQSSRAAAVYVGFVCGLALPVVSLPAALFLIALTRTFRAD